VQVAQAQAQGTEETSNRLERLGADVRQIADQAAGSARALDQAVDGSSASFKELAHRARPSAQRLLALDRSGIGARSSR
jgi:methyl-accepting chemotaxis protein